MNTEKMFADLSITKEFNTSRVGKTAAQSIHQGAVALPFQSHKKSRQSI